MNKMLETVCDSVANDVQEETVNAVLPEQTRGVASEVHSAELDEAMLRAELAVSGYVIDKVIEETVIKRLGLLVTEAISEVLT